MAVVVTGNQLPVLPDRMKTAAALAEPPAFDLTAAAELRQAQCLLDNVLRKGGTEMKKVARGGLYGTDSALLAAANDRYWEATPLAAAYKKDQAWSEAKLKEISGRDDAWKGSLNVTQTPPGYTITGFQWPPSNPSIFESTGLTGWIADRFWQDESDFYQDRHPVAGKESVDAVTKIATTRYSEDRYEDYEDWKAWEGMTFMHPMYADDARIFLQNGGFPTSAPEPGSMEFRVDVENLKARFASCASTNPPDPHKVLTPELTLAAMEWQAEAAGQKEQRDAILGAEAQASADLQVASQAMAESLGQSLIASRLTEWEAYYLKQSPGTAGLDYPTKAEFAQVKSWIADAQARAAGRLYVASRAALSAKQQADKVAAAQTAAYAIADKAGLPRGRGLMYGQQAVQITKASAAAAQAAAKATETASNATRASAADSKTLHALAKTQSHATKAEFRRKAAEEAEAQAKAAAEGAAEQAKLAAENASKAKNAQVKAEAAEATAKKAAADAKAKRETAEAERDIATAARKRADAERAKANEAEGRAVTQRQAAATALAAAEKAGGTASTKLGEAVAAENKAAKARDDAFEAERNKNATAARAAATEAAAAAAEGTEAAGETRAAAVEARTAANQAGTAASSARTAANEASGHAVNARTAATQAQGAAARSRAASEGAAAAAAVTTAQVKKAHAAAAEAIDASDAAAQNVKRAEAFAKTAASEAVEARQNATAARTESILAAASAVETAGYAYATAQAAAAARDSAAQVIKPANDAIELGSPYAETDSSAGLAVLTGQAAKTAGEQQEAVAKAKAVQAKKAAAEAAALAVKADADAKAAAEAASRAAGWASKAAESVEQARASAAVAKKAADAAKKAEANTVEYDRQAHVDAAFAAKAADVASNEAAAADDAATEAEKDAAGARSAASAAESDAGRANSVATVAEGNATKAETAAANAHQSATEADKSATRAEEELRKRIEEARQERANAGSPDVGSDLSSDEEAILLRLCGQECVDQYRAARALAGQDLLDWVKANGGQILLDYIGWPDIKACLTQGDVEACLWTLFNVVSTLIPVGKIPGTVKVIVKISMGVVGFFEKSATAKRTLGKLKKLIDTAKKDPDTPPCKKKLRVMASQAAAKSSAGNAAAAFASLDPDDPLDACTLGTDSEISDEVYDILRRDYGDEVADGVDYNYQRMHDGTATSGDHSLPGIGRDVRKLAEYLKKWKDKGTHYDSEKQQMVKVAYDDDNGVLVIVEGHRVHAYTYPEEKFLFSGRYKKLG